MALTPSNMLPLGTKAPQFNLLDVKDNAFKPLKNLKGEKGTLVMFICNHCPYVLHVNEQLVELAKDYEKEGISTIAISSNDVEKYPEDHPDKMKLHAKKHHYTFPYLYDESQDIARAYSAACTPDFFLFDANLSLVYTGRLDGSRPGNDIPVTGKDLRTAMTAIVNSEPVPKDQKPSMGCNIKWKS